MNAVLTMLPAAIAFAAAWLVNRSAADTKRLALGAIVAIVLAGIAFAWLEGGTQALGYTALALAALVLAVAIHLTRVRNRRDGVPSMPFVLLGSFALLAGAPDLRWAALAWVPWLASVLWATGAPRTGDSRMDAMRWLLPAFAAVSVVAGAWVLESDALGAWLILVGAAVALPLFPLHGWYQSLVVATPTVSRTLAATLLPVGALMLLLRLPADALDRLGWVIVPWAAIGLVYAAFRAFAQVELRRLIGFLVMASAALAALGLGNAQPAGLAGAGLQAMSLILVCGGLLLLAGRIAGPDFGVPLESLGGLAPAAPRLALALILMLMASIQLPGFGGFAAWWLLLSGSDQLVGLAGLVLALILGASVVARTVRVLLFGETAALARRQLDLSARELGLIAILLGADLILGLAPGAVLAQAGMAPS